MLSNSSHIVRPLFASAPSPSHYYNPPMDRFPNGYANAFANSILFMPPYDPHDYSAPLPAYPIGLDFIGG